MSDPRTAPSGVLEIHPRGHGFLRNPAKNYLPTTNDPYVPGQLIDKFNLAEGVLLSGPLEARRAAGRCGPRLAVDPIDRGADPAQFRRRNWDELTPIDPHRWIRLETGPEPLTTRVMDLFTPIGKGHAG